MQLVHFRSVRNLFVAEARGCVLCLPSILISTEIRTVLNIAWPLISQSRTLSNVWPTDKFTVASTASSLFAYSRVFSLAVFT